MIRYIFVISVLFTVTLADIYPQAGARAVFTELPPVIDGNTSDSIWARAEIISDFYQREPKFGDPVSERTEFRFMYTRSSLFIAVKCFDDPRGITAKEMLRDAVLTEDDRCNIIMDTYLDGRNGYWFQIGPRGSMGDALISENGKNFNKAWDGLWTAKARIVSDGWEAELDIPFKTIGYKKGQETWGLKVIRHIKRKAESSYWPATSLNANVVQISDAGRLTGITNISQGFGLDLVPFVSGITGRQPDKGSKQWVEGGFDAFYHITSSLKVSVTANTDFAQTEVDERQINLTRFNLFFPEKRDFFLDGASYFNFGINGEDGNPQSTQLIPFFSRRIGLDTAGNPISIRYGGKFTGKTDKWNFGFLHIKDNNIYDNPGYSAGRITRNIGKLSSIGIIGTSGNAFSDERNSLAGFDLRLVNSEIGGNKNLIFNLYGIKSFTENLKGNDISFGSELSFPNDLFNFRIGYLQIGESFFSGLGFVPRKNIRDFYGGIGTGPRPKNSAVLQIKSGIDYTLISNLEAGGMESAQVDFKLSEITFLSGDIILLTSQFQAENLHNDFKIFGDNIITPDEYHFWRNAFQLTSAKRRKIWGSTKIIMGSFYSGRRTDWLIQSGCKISVPVFLGFESDRRWVSLPAGDFVAQIYRVNLNIHINPDISLYNFAQYENQTETIGLQSRFQWIIKPGKEIFLTFNSPMIDPMERFKAETFEARMKVKYTIRF
jgi:hypothetical protein